MFIIKTILETMSIFSSDNTYYDTIETAMVRREFYVLNDKIDSISVPHIKKCYGKGDFSCIPV